MTPRATSARRLRLRPRPRSRARHSARWTPRWISASFARRSTRIVARSPTRAEGGAHSCAARPRTSSSRSARARTVPGEPSRAWTPSRSSKPSRRWSDPRRTPAPWARARPRRPHPRAVVVVLNPARARTPSRRPPRDAPRTHPSSRRPFEHPRTSPPVDGRTGTTLAHPSSRAARRTTRTLDDDAPTTLPSLSSRSAPHPSISLFPLPISLRVSLSPSWAPARQRGTLAPSAAPSLQTSPKTPPAVTSAPAPGPRTMSGVDSISAEYRID